MQRFPSLIFLVAALYVSLTAHATNAPVSPAEKSAPHIALLLPLKSTALGQAAEAVRQGFFAAAGTQPQALPVRVYAASSESLDNIIWLYRQAIANGARAVVGPLTRNGVAALADYPDIAVPTLALNMADALDADKLYFFGLPAEAEARQVARLAAQEKLRTAIIISNGTPLSRRLTQAFAEEWKALGGTIISELLYNDDPTALASLPTAMGNMIFLAADAEKARLIRPYLDSALPVYATSQLFNGNTDTLTNYDLKDVNFVDMPWLLQSDHPAVMIYPRANPPLTPDMERLYALGIDAYRLLQVMLSNHLRTALPLDGVTGRISLHDDHHFQRVAIPAIFKQGLGLTPEEAAALAAAQAAALAATRAAAASGVPPAAVPAQ